MLSGECHRLLSASIIDHGGRFVRNCHVLSNGLRLSAQCIYPDDRRAGERRPAIIMMHGFGANMNGGPEWVCRQFAA